MEERFDLIVIGSGSAGTNAALAVRKRGWSVAAIDEKPFGGTCALRGCDPKKVLVAAARALVAAARYESLGILDRAPSLDWAALMRFKQSFTDPVPEERRKTYEDAGIVPIRGTARFSSAHSIEIGDRTIRAKRFLVASGNEELHVARGDEDLLTSESFLEMKQMPESLIFVGGGYIAFEFAHVAARAGAHVTILNESDTPLHGFDREIVERLLDATRQAGITVHLNAKVESVERTGSGITVHAQKDGEPQTYDAREGVLAAGRVPALDRLNLDAAGIERTKKGVKVNGLLQSVSNPDVYAAGDCADGGGLPLTPVAGYEGEIVASNIVDRNAGKPDFRALPTMVYAIPPLGQAGLTEVQARQQGLDIEVAAGDMSQWFSTRHVAAAAACYKIVMEKGSGKILGATLLGPHAEEQTNVLALAMRYQLTRSQIADTLFAYPTASSDLESML